MASRRYVFGFVRSCPVPHKLRHAVDIQPSDKLFATTRIRPPGGITRDLTNNMTRRADGELETDVLRALWNLDRPASPGDVIEEMKTGLAYTSIATILTRLCEKGLATRSRAGRVYVYAAARSEADHAAQRILSILDSASDRRSALAGFALSLDPAEAAQLAALLNESQ